MKSCQKVGQGKRTGRTIQDGIGSPNSLKTMKIVKLTSAEKITLSPSRLLEAIGLGVLSADIQGNISFVSKSGLQLTGWQEEQVLGKNVADFIPQEFRTKTYDIIRSVSDGNSWLGEIPIRLRDGYLVLARANINPVFDDNGVVAGSIGVIIGFRNKGKTAGPISEIGEKDSRTALSPSQEGILESLKPKPENPQHDSVVDDESLPDRHYQADTVDLLKEIQNRFQAAREQLNQLTEALSREEYLVRQMHLLLRPDRDGAFPDENSEISGNKFRLDVCCLGMFKVGSAAKQIQQWQSNRAKSVFEYLVSKYTTPVSRDILMGALWPDYGPKAAANNLKTAIHDLRQILCPLFSKMDYPVILYSNEGYLINSEIELVIDAELFESFWNQGKRLEKEGKTNESMRSFEKAEALYKGDYLEDSLYDEWTISRRETLKDIYLLLLNKLADYSINTADYENCITYCHKILEKDNCREDTYRMLMSSYSRLRQKNNALRWYENCRQTLAAELNSPPSEETIGMFNRLKRDETV